MMWEFFWFILGALVYASLSFIINLSNKIVFVQDIKIIAFKLICNAFEDMVYARSLKYKELLEDESICEEKLKIFENDDENYIQQWKKDTIDKLHSSVPPLYKAALDVETWESLMSFLEAYYKKRLDPIKKIKEAQDG